MAYDTDLADRIRPLLDTGAGELTEKRMFGGLAFLVGGKLAVAASGRGGIMVRVDPADYDRLLDRPGVEPVVMRDRPTTGWVRVLPDSVRTKRQLAGWVDRAVAYVRTLSAN